MVVNDASTDATAEIVRPFADARQLTLLTHEENQRTAAAINTGIDALAEMGVGPDIWWTWISSDNTHDLCWRERFEAAVDEGVGVVYSAFLYVTVHGREQKIGSPHDPRKLINQEDCYYGPSFVIRSDVWQKVGGHRGKISHDYDHWLRVEEACWEMDLEIVYIDEPLMRYLAHPERASCLRRDEYDVPEWRTEGWKRRNK